MFSVLPAGTLCGKSEKQFQISVARKHLDWEEMSQLSMNPETARRYHSEAKPEKEDTDKRQQCHPSTGQSTRVAFAI